MACVLLLIRQNIWTFPLGLIYAAVTVVVLFYQQLYINLLENLYYLVMNAYGWIYWQRGQAVASGGLSAATLPQTLPITRLSRRDWLPIVAFIAVVTLTLGFGFDRYTDADLAYWDSFTTTVSFVAMWLAARKVIDNWWLWLLVDVLYVGLYSSKGLMPYALLYTIYIALAVWGFRAWQDAWRSQRALLT